MKRTPLGIPNRPTFDYEAYMEGCRVRLVLTQEIELAMRKATLDVAALAKRAHMAPAFLQRVLDGERRPQVETLARLLLACGARFHIERRPVKS